MKTGLPPICDPARRRFIVRLVSYGLGHAGIAFGIAFLFRQSLTLLRHSKLSWAEPAGILALAAVGYVLRVMEARDAESLGQDYAAEVRQLLFEKVIGRSFADQAKPRLGTTLNRMFGDLGSLRNWASQGFARMVSAGISLLGLLGALAWFSGGVAAMATGFVVMTGGALAALSPSFRRSEREARLWRGKLANHLGEKVPVALTTKHFGQVQRELTRTHNRSRRLRSAMIRRAVLSGAIRRLPEFAHGGLLVGLLLVFSWRQVAGAEAHTVALLLCGMIVASLRDLARAWDQRLVFLEGRLRLASLLEADPTPEQSLTVSLPGTGPVAVTFAGVGFRTQMRNLSLHAAAGERILIVGPSGSGKSTLLRLAARLLAPTEGEIFFDSQPLRGLAGEGLSRVVQFVSPDVPLLRGTVERNLRYAAGSTDPAWLDEVAALCGLIGNPAFPDGLKTYVAERGANLSSGARALLALARALAAKPRLLLVDDAVFTIDEHARSILRTTHRATAATTLIVGNDRICPILTDQIWRFGSDGIAVERVFTANKCTERLPPTPLALIDFAGAPAHAFDTKAISFQSLKPK